MKIDMYVGLIDMHRYCKGCFVRMFAEQHDTLVKIKVNPMKLIIKFDSSRGVYMVRKATFGERLRIRFSKKKVLRGEL